MTKTRGKKNAHTGSVRGKTPPVEPQAVSAPPPVDREQRIISNEPFHPANDSPRTKQAKQSVNRLKQLDIWDPLTSVHRKLCSLDDPDFTTNATTFVDLIFKAHAELKDIIPEFKSITDKPRLATVARNVYSNLAAEIASYSDVDKALSLVLVHVARTLPAPKLSQEDIEDNAHTSAQFGCAYYGNTPDRFLESVTEHDRKFNELDPSKGKIYLRGTSIVQSSGTGKSRMVYECRYRTPLLYVCIGPTSAEGSATESYPLPDRGVRSFFEEAQITHKDLCNLQIACFLGAWFSVLAERLGKLPTQQQKHDYLMQLNRLDNNAGQNPQRTDFFQTVSKLASKILADADRSLNDRDDRSFSRYILSPLDTLDQEMKSIIAHMHSFSPHNTASPTPPVLVAFDKCVELNVDGVDEVNNPLNSLRRAWNYISRLQGFSETPTFSLVLISTSSDATRLVEDARNFSLLGPPPIFFGIGFDQLLAERPALSRASQASTDSHIIHYGRPLWSSLSPDQLWPMAKLKLTGADDFCIDSTTHCFSVLASRLALYLWPFQSPGSALFARERQFLDSVVDRHMRIVARVTSEGVKQVTSPSEPALAIAASNIMLDPQLEEPQKMTAYKYADILEKFRKDCLFDPAFPLLIRSFGELASRVILMAACDAVKRRRIEESKPKESSDTQHVGASIYAKPVRLESVLENLADLDEANLAALRQRLEDVYDAGSRTERHAIPFRDQSQSASATLPMWINFTHFDLLTDAIDEITPEFLWHCWKRGVAVQIENPEYGLDGIIPVFIGHLDRPFVDGSSTDASNITLEPGEAEMHAARYMTYVAWEAKNQRDPQSTTVPARSAPAIAGPVIKSALMAPPNEKPLTEQALLSVLLDLGTRTGFKQAPDGLRPQVIPLTGQQCPRLCIRGMLDSHTYPCLDLFELRPTLVDILSSSSDSAFNPVSFMNNLLSHG